MTAATLVDSHCHLPLIERDCYGKKPEGAITPPNLDRTLADRRIVVLDLARVIDAPPPGRVSAQLPTKGFAARPDAMPHIRMPKTSNP